MSSKFILLKFNVSINVFSDIKVMGPYINFYINYETFSSKIINEIELSDYKVL